MYVKTEWHRSTSLLIKHLWTYSAFWNSDHVKFKDHLSTWWQSSHEFSKVNSTDHLEFYNYFLLLWGNWGPGILSEDVVMNTGCLLERETPRNVIKHTPKYVCEGFLQTQLAHELCELQKPIIWALSSNKQPRKQACLHVHTWGACVLVWSGILLFLFCYCFHPQIVD